MTTRRSITCSFCKTTGHNITRCNDDELHRVWGILLTAFIRIEFTIQDLDRQMRYLENEVDFRVVKALSIRFCNGRVSDSRNVIFEKIYSCIFEMFTEIAYDDDDEIGHYIDIIDVVDIRDSEPKTTNIIEPLLLCLETIEELQEEMFCAICLETHKKISMLITNCNHEFCKNCICEHLDYASKNSVPKCPMCRTKITTLEIKDVDYYNEIYNRYVKNNQNHNRVYPDPDNIADIDFLDSFDFYPESVF